MKIQYFVSFVHKNKQNIIKIKFQNFQNPKNWVRVWFQFFQVWVSHSQTQTQLKNLGSGACSRNSFIWYGIFITIFYGIFCHQTAEQGEIIIITKIYKQLSNTLDNLKVNIASTLEFFLNFFKIYLLVVEKNGI